MVKKNDKERSKSSFWNRNRGKICAFLISTILFLVSIQFHDSLNIHKGNLHYNATENTYDVKNDTTKLEGELPAGRTLYLLGVFTVIIGLLAGWVFDLNDDMAKKEELEQLKLKLMETNRAVTTSLDQALSLPPDNNINPEAFSKIKATIRKELIEKIQDQFFRKNQEILNYLAVQYTLKKMLTALGNQIDDSDSVFGLPVEDLAWSSDITHPDNSSAFKKDYPSFVEEIVRRYSVEFRGVSLMPPCMWTDKDDRYGLHSLMSTQEKRITQLSDNLGDYGIAQVRFERILMCPSKMVGTDTNQIAQLRKDHIKAGIKLKIVGMSTNSQFKYEDFTSNRYYDYVLVKCRSAEGKNMWFVITSMGFNKLTMQNDLFKRAESDPNKPTPGVFLSNLFDTRYPDFVEGRLIYNEVVVRTKYIDKWNQIVDSFQDEDKDSPNADVTRIEFEFDDNAI